MKQQHPICALTHTAVAPLLIQFAANVPGKAVGNGPNTWCLSGSPRRSLALSGPAPAVAATEGINLWIEDLSLCQSLFATVHLK